MKLTKKFSLLSLSLCLGITAPINSYADDNTNLNRSENLVATFLKSQGVTTFMILNKNRGTLSGIYNGQRVLEVKALFGREKGDELMHEKQKTTPAGIFEITPTQQQEDKNSALVFHHRPDGSRDAIHRLLNIPKENRYTRIFTKNPKDNYITGGCINVLHDDYITLSNFAIQGIQNWHKPDGTIVQTSILVTLPEQQTLAETRRILNIPDEFQPEIAATVYNTPAP